MKEFVISDESVNKYGFKVLTAGINLTEFKKNPVMYYNHQRELGVIGRWENIRIESGRVLATPVFDLNDDLGRKIYNKVESGFIRAASISMDSEKMSKHGDEVDYCEVVECSVCDIPANSNALVLYHKGAPVKDKEAYIKLNLNDNKVMNDNELKKILAALDLSAGSTVNDIISRIELLRKETPGAIIENAIRLNIIQPYEKDGLLQMAQNNLGTFGKYMNDRKTNLMKERKEEANLLVKEAIKDARLEYRNGETLKFLEKSFENDYEGTKAFLANLPKRVSIVGLINQANEKKSRVGWTLKDYRQKAPQELLDNPELYDSLLKEENERKEKKNSK